MVAHSGGPPVAMYLLPLGLSKELYAGTTSLFFTVSNAVKVVPWLLLVKPTGNVWTLMAICLLAIPTGVWLGWPLHGRLDQRQLYRTCYGLLLVTALKLLWDGVSGYLGRFGASRAPGLSFARQKICTASVPRKHQPSPDLT